MRSYFQQAIFLSTINLNIKRKLTQQMSFLKVCTYLQHMNTKQQTAVINPFGMFVEKSAEIPESERFLNTSSTRLIQTDTTRHQETMDVSKRQAVMGSK
jgi:hypothetical protein